jgi:RNA polymerase sigma-70 factor (ECF subfamily)
MNENTIEHVREQAEAIYRTESRRVFATLIRLLGDFDLAEEALHDAFRAALEQWPTDGVPANPRAWLVSAGRFKAIDGIRRRARFDSLEDRAEEVESIRPIPSRSTTKASPTTGCASSSPAAIRRLRLMPRSRSRYARSAAHDRGDCASLPEPCPTLAQRIVRAKAKIRDARIRIKSRANELPARLDGVLRVIYLVFNEDVRRRPARY